MKISFPTTDKDRRVLDIQYPLGVAPYVLPALALVVWIAETGAAYAGAKVAAGLLVIAWAIVWVKLSPNAVSLGRVILRPYHPGKSGSWWIKSHQVHELHHSDDILDEGADTYFVRQKKSPAYRKRAELRAYVRQDRELNWNHLVLAEDMHRTYPQFWATRDEAERALKEAYGQIVIRMAKQMTWHEALDDYLPLGKGVGAD